MNRIFGVTTCGSLSLPHDADGPLVKSTDSAYLMRRNLSSDRWARTGNIRPAGGPTRQRLIQWCALE